MPYPNEHACRLEDPDRFQDGSFRRTTRESDGKEYSIISGRLKGETTMTEQAYRYDKEVWSESEAKSHCKDHDGSFEAAEKATHPHGEHICECPECGEETTVTEDVKCNTQECPECGTRMRAKDIGERRSSMDNIERKSVQVELKEGEGEEGSFTARIATLNVIDKDGDMTLPGAFKNGVEVLVSAYMHGSWMGGLPVGKAVIHEEGDDVLAEGEFNLKTETGREHYEAVKFSGKLQEWSYGFKVDESGEKEIDDQKVRLLKKVTPFEISPVLLGAGVGTATLAIKNDKATYADQAETVLAAVTDLVTRTESLADLRRKEGRVLSSKNRERIKKLLEMLSGVASDLKELLDATEPVDDEKLAQAVLLYTKIKRELMEVN